MFPFAMKLVRGAVLLVVLIGLVTAAQALPAVPGGGSVRVHFTADPMIGYAPLDVVLDATDDMTADFYSWDIDWDGDGLVDDEGNDDPVYEVTYEEPGRYYPVFRLFNNDFGLIARVVTEVIVNNPEEDSGGDDIYGGIDPGYGTPTYNAILHCEPQTGEAPLTVYFTGEGVDKQYYLYWELDYDGDGMADEEGNDEPEGEYEYTAAGTYYPQLTYYNDDYGVVTQAQTTVLVTAPAGGEDIGTPGLTGPRLVTLMADPEAGDAPLPVEFEVDGIDEDEYTSWALDVDGDGAADMDDYGEFAAAITYGQPGTYYPAVALFNDDGGTVGMGGCEVEVYVNADVEMLDPGKVYLQPGQLTDTLAPERFEPVLTALPDYGFAPFNVNFAVSGVEIDDYAYWELDWDGDGQYDGGDKGAVIWLVTYDTPGQYNPTVWFYDDNQQLLGEATTEVYVADPDQARLIDDAFPFDGDPEYLAEKWIPRVDNVKQLTLTATPAKGDAPFEPEFTVSGVDFNYWLWELDWESDGTCDRASQTWNGKVEGYYSMPGKYTAKLTFYNDSNQVIAEGETPVEVTGAMAVEPHDGPQNAVALKAFPTSGFAPLTVAFDAREIEPDNWYAWGFDQGDGVTLYPEGRPVPQATYNTPGKYRASITFYDVAYKQLVYAVAEIEVKPGPGQNSFPPQDVVADLRVEYFPQNKAPWTVMWDARNSYPFGDIRMFRWDTTGDGGYTIQLSDKYTHEAKYDRPGRYTVGLEVEDKNGKKDQAVRTIVLGECYADLSCYPVRGTVPFTIRCDASGSWSAQGIKRYYWKTFLESETSIADNEYYVTDSTSPYWEHTFTAPGKYKVVVAVNDGQFTDMGMPKAYIPIEVVSSGSAPSAVLYADATGGPAPLHIYYGAGSSRDQDGSIASYTWDGDINDNVPPTTKVQGGDRFDYIYETPGKYTAALYVTDNDGLSSEIETVEIVVHSPSGGPPTAKLTATVAKGTAPFTVDFDATGSFDTDGTVDSYLLRPDNTAPSIVLQNTTGKFQYTYKYSGTYSATLWVQDNDGFGSTNEAKVRITVEQSAQGSPDKGGPIPVVTFTAGSGLDSLTANFDATASYVLDQLGAKDPQGKITTVYFDPNFRDTRDGYVVKGMLWSHTYGYEGTYYAAVIMRDAVNRRSEPYIIKVVVKKPAG